VPIEVMEKRRWTIHVSFFSSGAGGENRMAQKELSTYNVREILRLRYELGLLQHEIARSCGISQPTVHRYLERAKAAGLSCPLSENCDDRRLNELLFAMPSAQ
jgi:DNA invertase Pin-like site-specific DNA recombinase